MFASCSAQDVSVQIHGCSALSCLAASSVACGQTVAEAGGATAAVAALCAHPSETDVQANKHA